MIRNKNLVIVSVVLTRAHVEFLDSLVSRREYSSRSEAMRKAVTDFMIRQLKKK